MMERNEQIEQSAIRVAKNFRPQPKLKWSYLEFELNEQKAIQKRRQRVLSFSAAAAFLLLLGLSWNVSHIPLEQSFYAQVEQTYDWSDKEVFPIDTKRLRDVYSGLTFAQ